MWLNIQSLVSQVNLLRLYITRSIAPPHIIALIECQTNTQATEQLKLLGYNQLYLPAPQLPNQSITQGGGTMLYSHHSLTINHLPQLSLSRFSPLDTDPSYGRTSSAHYFDCRFNTHKCVLRVGVIYLSPSTHHNDQAINELQANIITVAEQSHHLPLLIGGDFNLRCRAWDTNLTQSAINQNAHFRWANDLYESLIAQASLSLLNIAHQQAAFKPTRPDPHANALRDSSSVIDLCFVNDLANNLVRSFTVDDTLLGDHLPLIANLTLNEADAVLLPSDLPERWSVHSNNDWKAILPTIIEQTLTNDQSFKQLHANLTTSQPTNQDEAQSVIQGAWSHFTLLLDQSMSKCIQRGTGTRKYHWFTQEVAEQHDRVQKYRTKWRRYRTTQSAAYHLAQYKQEQKALKQIIKQSKAQSMKNLYQSVLSNPQSPLLWSALARIRPSKARVALGSIPDEHGKPPINQVESLNNLCKKFISYTQPTRPVDPILQSKLDRYMEIRTNQHIPAHCSDDWSWSADQIKDQCCWQRNSKSAAGPDGIPPIVMKYLSDTAYSFLSSAFNYSWKHSVLPHQWTDGNIFALLKDHTKPINDSNNYRPITVTSIFIRTFEHLIHKRLSPLIHKSNSIAPIHHHQFGFKQSHSCANAIHLVTSTIQSTQQTNCPSPLPIAFIDFRKAFDTVWHAYLLYCLERDFNISGRCWRWFARWFKRRARCVAQGISSLWHFILNYSVPQGTVMSPILFIVFINRIAVRISRSCPLIDLSLYADDLAMFPKSLTAFNHAWDHAICKNDRVSIRNSYAALAKRLCDSRQTNLPMLRLLREIAIARQLQRALSLLSAWLLLVGMQANPSKSKLVIFSSAALVNHHWLHNRYHDQFWYRSLKLDGFVLGVVEEYEYLGVTLQCQLDWSSHTSKLLHRASNVSAMLCRLFVYKNQQPHPLAAIKLVKALIIPVIEYGIEFWYHLKPSQSNKTTILDQLHATLLKPIRLAFNLPIHSHRLGLLVDCGIPSLHDLAHKAACRYFLRYASFYQHTKPNIQSIAGDRAKLYSINHLVPPRCKSVNQPVNPLAGVHPAAVQILRDAFYSPDMNLAKASNITRWSSLGQRVRFSIERQIDYTLTQAQADPALQSMHCVKYHVPLQPMQQPPSVLNTHHTIERANLSEAALIATFYQWKEQWKSMGSTSKRDTSAPLTEIKSSPGTACLLRYMSDNRAIQVIMRLRHGRAFTHDTRFRFNSKTQPVSDAYCKNPVCLANRQVDSVKHLLTECPAHSQIKQHLLDDWKQLKIGNKLNSITDLSFKLLLGEPIGKPSSHTRQQYLKWYSSLSTFIISLYQNLPTAPNYPVPL